MNTPFCRYTVAFLLKKKILKVCVEFLIEK